MYRAERHSDQFLNLKFDFGYRAVHLSTIFSKKIVEEYYKKKPSYSYWLGCSSGGKQGL
jgi:feruloyl esterase